MHKPVRLVLIVVCAFAVGCCLFASCSNKGKVAEMPQEFSADIITTTPMGSFTGKLFVSKDKTRMELPQSIVITRQDKGKVWILMPGHKAYLEQDLGPEYAMGFDGKFPGERSRELIASETIDGKEVEKYKITFSLIPETEAETEITTVYQWIEKKSRRPVKTQSDDGSWMYRFANVKEGVQSMAIFEMPEGYNKFEIPAAEGISEMPKSDDLDDDEDDD